VAASMTSSLLRLSATRGRPVSTALGDAMPPMSTRQLFEPNERVAGAASMIRARPDGTLAGQG
jgi:hypothetical protein